MHDVLEKELNMKTSIDCLLSPDVTHKTVFKDYKFPMFFYLPIGEPAEALSA